MPLVPPLYRSASRGPAVPHRVSDRGSPTARPSHIPYPRAADFYPPGRFPGSAVRRRGAHGDTGPGRLQAVGQHLDRIAVAGALVLWWRMIRFEYALIVTTRRAACAVLRLAGTLRRDDHGAVAAGVGADLVGPARRRPRGALGGGGSLSGLFHHKKHPTSPPPPPPQPPPPPPPKH